ncbi:MAG: hypothetical protein BWX48_03436 [Verrucomicrobia bacterium ADurb.Bin006]|nr:MAG: hypothetical protein BWX48_03436 [Verrucomicrobia bacterium ADurb.Bin006]
MRIGPMNRGTFNAQLPTLNVQRNGSLKVARWTFRLLLLLIINGLRRRFMEKGVHGQAEPFPARISTCLGVLGFAVVTTR